MDVGANPTTPIFTQTTRAFVTDMMQLEDIWVVVLSGIGANPIVRNS